MKRRNIWKAIGGGVFTLIAGCLTADFGEDEFDTESADEADEDEDESDTETADEADEDEGESDTETADEADEDEDESDTEPADEADEDEDLYESIVVFRNDDIRASYKPDIMRKVNDIFIDENVPVTLGIIPNFRGEVPLTDDSVCTYLQSLESEYPDQFEMALHGYTHTRKTEFHGGSEFGGLPADEQQERIAKGEELLAECVNSPSRTFIPPQNTYDETTVEVLEEADYTTVSGGGWFTEQYFDSHEETYFESGGLLHIPESQAFENWSPDDDETATTDEYEVPFYDLETMIERFDDDHERNKIHVIMLHYQFFTSDDRLSQLRSLIQHIQAEEGVGFMTLEQLATGLKTGTVEQIDGGWRVLDPLASEVW